jgi:hypothetical protein
MAEAPQSRWSKFQAQIWEHTFSEFDGMTIKFRESGSMGAVLTLLRGDASSANLDAAATEMVCTTIIDPILTREEFNALSLTHKMILVSHILERAEKRVSKDFRAPVVIGPSTAPLTLPTPSGSPGEQPSVSVSLPPQT